MKTIRFLIFAVCCATAVTFAACNDEGNSYDPGEITMSLIFPDESDGTRIVEASIREPREKTFSMKVAVDKGSTKNVTAVLAAAPALVDVYNEANETSYQIVPATAYSFDYQEAILPRYNLASSVVGLTFKTAELPDEAKYLLPVTIREVKGDDNIVLGKDATAYIIFSKEEIVIGTLISGQDDQTNIWQVLYTTTTHATEGKQSYLVDNDDITYWHHDYSNYSPAVTAGKVLHEIIIDMKRTMDVYGVEITGRIHQGAIHRNGMLSEIDISVAPTLASVPTTDIGIVESEWKGKSHFNAADLAYQIKNSVFLDEPTKGRYLRISIYSSYTNTDPYRYGGACTGEYRIWGFVVD